MEGLSCQLLHLVARWGGGQVEDAHIARKHAVERVLEVGYVGDERWHVEVDGLPASMYALVRAAGASYANAFIAVSLAQLFTDHALYLGIEEKS